jgi:putative ATPase
MAINEALSVVEHDTTNRPVPLHLRNAPTKLMDKLGYGQGYKYAHDYEGHWVEQEFMPQGMEGRRFYTPQNKRESDAAAWKEALKKN